MSPDWAEFCRRQAGEEAGDRPEGRRPLRRNCDHMGVLRLAGFGSRLLASCFADDEGWRWRGRLSRDRWIRLEGCSGEIDRRINGPGIDLAEVPLVAIAGYWDVGIGEAEAGFDPETTAVFLPPSLPKRAAVLDGRQGWAAGLQAFGDEAVVAVALLQKDFDGLEHFGRAAGVDVDGFVGLG